jgi:hypothetical protein
LFCQCLACFRPDLSLQAALKEISGPDESARLHVQDWVRFRAMGSAEVEGAFADIYASEWVAMLRRKLASRAIALGITEFDLSALQAPRPRRLTQLASRVVHSRGLKGICYCSRFGSEFENWALFEPWTLRDANCSALTAGGAELVEAMRRLGIPAAMA